MVRFRIEVRGGMDGWLRNWSWWVKDKARLMLRNRGMGRGEVLGRMNVV